MSIMSLFFYEGSDATAFDILKKIIKLKKLDYYDAIVHKDELVKALSAALKIADKNHEKYQTLSSERKEYIQMQIAKKLEKDHNIAYYSQLVRRPNAIDEYANITFIDFPKAFLDTNKLVPWIKPVIEEQKRFLSTYNTAEEFGSTLMNYYDDMLSSERFSKTHQDPLKKDAFKKNAAASVGSLLEYVIEYPECDHKSEVSEQFIEKVVENIGERAKRPYQEIYEALMDYSQAQAGSEIGAMFFRFFKGHWGNHHGAAVAKYLLNNNFEKIENKEELLTVIKGLENVSFENKNGTLANIVSKANVLLKP